MEPRALGPGSPPPVQYYTADDYKNAYGTGQSPFANGQVVVHNGQNYIRVQTGHDEYGNPTYNAVPYGAVNPGQAGPGQPGGPGAPGAAGAGGTPGNPGGYHLTDPALLAKLAQGGSVGTGEGGVVGVNPYGPTPGALAAANFGGSAAPGSPIGNMLATMQARNAAMQAQPMTPGIGGGSAMPVHNVASFQNMLANLKAAPAAPMAAAPMAPGK